MFFSHFLNWISCIEFLARNFLQRFCEKKFLTRNRAMYSQNHTMQVLFIVYSHNAVLKFSILLCVPKKRTYNGKNIWPKKNSQKTLSLSKKRRWFALAFLTLGWPLLWWGAHTYTCETLHWIMEVTFVELSQGISCQKGQKIR